MRWVRAKAPAWHEVQGLRSRRVGRCLGLRQNRNRELHRRLGEDSLAGHRRLPEDVEWLRSARLYPHGPANDAGLAVENGRRKIRLRVASRHVLADRSYRQEWPLPLRIPLWSAARIPLRDRSVVHRLVYRRYQVFWQLLLLLCLEIVSACEHGVFGHLPSRQKRTAVRGLPWRRRVCDSQRSACRGGTAAVRRSPFVSR